VRINLYARLAKLSDESDVDARAEEIEDRFVAVTFRTERSGDAAIDRLIAASDGRLAWRGERLVYARETSSAEERKSVTLKLITKLAEVQG
jgi:hypothetical protein